MNFKEHLTLAWEMTLQNVVPLVLMTLVMFVVSFFTLGILAPVMLAGYMHAVLLIIRDGREPKIGDLFAFMRFFLPLLLFSVVSVLAVSIGFVLLVLPGLALILALAVGAVYMLPLMTDKGLGLVAALQESMRMAFKVNFGEHLVAVLIFWFIQAIGGSVAIGALFTTPIAMLFLMSVYEERLGNQTTSMHAGNFRP